MVNAHKSVVRDQMRMGIVPPLYIQPARMEICGTCGQRIQARATHSSAAEPHKGAWEGRALVYRHIECPTQSEEGSDD